MPIYEYICSGCGHQEEFIQKVTDRPLTKCPNCGKQKFTKQVSSPAFQLKGEGWYVTDFRDKKKKTTDESKPAAAESKPAEAKPAEKSTKEK